MRFNASRVWACVCAGAALTGLSLASCQSAPRERAEARSQLDRQIRPYDASTRPIVEAFPRVDGPIEPSGPLLLAQQRLAAAQREPERVAPALAGIEGGELRHVKFSAVDATADQALRTLVGELMGRNYIIDPSVATQRVHIDIDAEMTDADLEDALAALAVVHGWAVEDRGDLVVVEPASGMARWDATPVIEARAAYPSQRVAARVFRMRYLPATQAQSVCQPLMSEGGALTTVGRSLVVVDRTTQLNRLGEVIRALDTPAFDGVEIWTYRLRHQTPEQASNSLNAISQAAGLAAAGDALASFVPVAGSDRLMVVSRDPTLQPVIRRWVGQVDQPYGKSERQRYLYRIQSYEPAGLQRLLGEVFAGRLAPSNAPPGDPRMRIVTAAEEDLMIIDATPPDYADLIALLRRIDRPRQQVLLQSVIAEVTLNDTLQWGVDYFLQTTLDDGILDFTGNALALGPAAPTGAVAFTATDGFAVLQALDSASEVTILDAPVLTATDKLQASIQVGAEVPILSASLDSETQTGGTSGIRNEVEYRDTGVILTVQPRVNEGGDVTLHLRLEITDAVPNVTSGIDSPQFTKRVVETDVTVPHGRTLLIGGIRSHRDVDRVQKIPFLGDVPGVGLAFQNVDKQLESTELLIAITPQIVSDSYAAAELVSDFVASSRGLEAALLRFADALPAEFAMELERDPRLTPPEPDLLDPRRRRDGDRDNDSRDDADGVDGVDGVDEDDADDDNVAPPAPPAAREPAAVANLRALASALPKQGEDAAQVARFLRTVLIRAEYTAMQRADEQSGG